MKVTKLQIDDLIGVRFKNHGRSVEEGFDCYGVAIEVSKRLGHTLYDFWYEKANEKTFSENYDAMLKKMSDSVEETDEQELGNLVLFADEAGRMIHIGVFLEKGLFIHADNGRVRLSRIDSYRRTKWKVYKWQQ